jgi:hypothetical protein
MIDNKNTPCSATNFDFLKKYDPFFNKSETVDSLKDNFINFLTLKNLNNSSSLEKFWLENRESMFEPTTSMSKIVKAESDNSIISEAATPTDILNLFDFLIKNSFIQIRDDQIIINLNDAKVVVDTIFSIFKQMPNESLIVIGNIVPALGVYFLHRKCVKLFSDYIIKQEINFTKNYSLNNPFNGDSRCRCCYFS